MSFNNTRGQVNIPLLALLAVLGIITYLLITQSFTFKNRLLNALYYKTPSRAYESVQIPPQNENKTKTTGWEQTWASPDYLSSWNKANFNCNSGIAENTLNLNCTSGSLTTKSAWSQDSSIIVNGTFSVKESDQPGYSTGIALIDSQDKSTISQISAGSAGSSSGNDLVLENYQPGSLQKFRLVFSKVNDERFVFYYLGDNPQPVKKAQINADNPISISLSCQGICAFTPLTISGVQTN